MKQFITTLMVTGGTMLSLMAQSITPGLIAHRGASHAAPENTMASMNLAWTEGADGVEGDFHLSSDGEVVCMHDFDTFRTTGTKLVVKDTPWAELAKLDAGAWKNEKYRGEKIPRFGDMLDALPADKFFFVEIKAGPTTIAPIKAILDSRKGKFDPRRVIIISFDAAAVAEAHRLLPEHEAHLVSAIKEYGDTEGMKRLDKTIQETGANGFQFKFRPDITASWLNGLRQRGLKLDSWVVDDPAQAAILISLGIDYITTDRPGPLRSELKQQGILK